MRTGRRSPASLVVLVLALLAAGVWQLRRASSEVAPPSRPTSGITTEPVTPAPRPSTGTSGSSVRRDLSVDEQRGGHTLARHVGRSDAELRARLIREPDISAASAYTDRAVAEATVTRAIAQSDARIRDWLDRRGPRPNLALDYRGSAGTPIGRSLRRAAAQSVSCTDAVVVLRWDGRDGFYVLTSYPEIRR